MASNTHGAREIDGQIVSCVSFKMTPRIEALGDTAIGGEGHRTRHGSTRGTFGELHRHSAVANECVINHSDFVRRVCGDELGITTG